MKRNAIRLTVLGLTVLGTLAVLSGPARASDLSVFLRGGSHGRPHAKHVHPGAHRIHHPPVHHRVHRYPATLGPHRAHYDAGIYYGRHALPRHAHRGHGHGYGPRPVYPPRGAYLPGCNVGSYAPRSSFSLSIGF